MKVKILTAVVLVFFGSLVNAQNNDAKRLSGSWLGTLTLPEGQALRIVMHYKSNGDKLSGSFDVPDQLIKDGFIDSVWIAKDSVFADFTTKFGKGTIYKGAFLPGDSVIRGTWIQGDPFPLNLRPTTYVYTPKSNLHPEFEGYKVVKLIASTPTKDQQNTGTCWSYATTSFIETEAIRLKKKPVVLSPMFFVIPSLIDKSEKYIRMQGNMLFNEGDLTFSVLKAYKKFGVIPEAVYSGKIDLSSIHEHVKMENTLRARLKDYVDNGRGHISADGYRQSIASIIYNTMAKAPETFSYNGKTYTPKSFAEENIGIDPDHYVEITSYTHHPFYSRFVLEMPSNWDNKSYLNVPIHDLTSIIDHALLNNYSVCWDGDIQGLNNGFCRLKKEGNITQEARQAAFDNYTTQDDHNMHIIGIAEDQDGKRFYIVKNSTSYANSGGYVYMSKDYLLLRTISVLVNKEALSKDITKKFKTGVL